MDAVRTNLLEESYDRIINVGFCLAPYQDLSDMVDPDVMIFGTTKDEQVFSLEELIEFFKSQYRQMENIEPSLERKRLYTRISEDHSSALIAEEITLNLVSEEIINSLYLRVSCVMQYDADRWRLTHWHASTPVETENDHWHMEEWKRENKKLQKLIDEQTANLQGKNRELKIEAALERIRAQATAMKESSDLLDIVVTMRSEFVNLGHEAHYFWHMRWLPEKYEKAMTSGDGTRIGMVMTLPRHIHGDIEPVKAWEKSDEPTYVLAMEPDMAVDYVDKMITLGDFEHVDPQAPSLDDVRQIGGLTFIMARTTHGEIGFSLPGVVPDPPKDAVDTLVRFAGVFDLAYKRFEDLKAAERQHREAQIELALERIRARTMAMQESNELAEVSSLLFQQMETLGVSTYSSGFTIWDEDQDELISWMCNADGSMNPPFRMPIAENRWHHDQYIFWKNGKDLAIKDFTGEEMQSYFRYLRSLPLLDEAFEKSIAAGHPMPERQVHHVANFSHGNLLFITLEPCPKAHELFKRFSKVFEQTYIRFLDLQQAEEQAREAEIQLALERVRARTMAMQKSEELADVAFVLFEQLRGLGGNLWGTGFGLCKENEDKDEFWFANENGVFPPVSIPNTEDPAHKKMYEGWNNNREFLAIEGSGQDLKNHYDYMMTLPEVRPFFQKILDEGLSFPEWQEWNAAYFSHGYLLIITLEPYPDKEILKRFARVFDQAYTRFLDLQKAEAQAREAQVNLAVERVRARALAMFKSEEILEVVYKLKEEIMGLDIPNVTAATIHLKEPDGKYRAWDLTSISEDENELEISLDIRWHREDTHPDFFMREVWDRTEDYFVVIQGGDRYKHTVEWLHQNGHSEHAVEFEEFLETSQLEKAYHPTVPLNNGRMCIDLLDPPALEIESILKKMAGAFDLAYKRFEDLQKAEAQAREAKIETALEKIRSRTMGMQSSDELPEVANLLFLEVQALDIPAWSCGYCILEEDRRSSICIMSSEGTLQKPFLLPHHGEVSFEEWDDFVQGDQTFFTQELGGEAIESHYGFMKSLPQLTPIFREIEEAGLSLPTYQINHLCKFGHGFLLFITYEPVPDAHGIFKRFTSVFDQTYTRFLDLKKAEAQTREAQIENALEKVRSRSLAMQHPDELVDVAQLLREEMGALGVEELETSSIYIHDQKNGNTKCWFTINDADDPEKSVTDQMTIDLQDTWVGRQMSEFYHSDQDSTSILMKGDHRIEWIRYCEEKSDLFGTSEFYGETIPERTYHLYKFSNGYLGAASPGNISEESWDLMKRATAVFSFAYTRFLDLQKALAQTREAEIELSLERVRSQVTAMRESSDLFDIVVKMRSEFISLGHEADYFWHMQWQPDIYEMSMTSEDGHRLGMVINIPKFVHDQIPGLAEWEKGNDPIYVLALDADDAWDYIENMNTHGHYEQVDPNAPSREDIEHIGGLTFIIARTSHGEIGFSLPGVVPDPPKDALDTLVRFAGVFDLAYQRFEDLQESEQQARLILEERDRLEVALKELHATKDQLIQQEKLASLGQLTAGIAHEIKNPLNFVNNFSELSVELVEEAREELSAVSDQLSGGDEERVDEALEILNNIEANLKTIHKHGYRADNIVKSMLEHSRGGSGKMEPTDLNALIKEFVNLTFHGMRASKSPINVDMEFDLDESIGEVPLIAEDFSRVIINLCNNAFDAMREKLNSESRIQNSEEYKPTLLIRTQQQNSSILLEIEDNGPGIPEAVKDKILQPFFTTKKGTEGTGLGLSITNDIVKAHGGKLSVKSSSGSGSTFIITLKP